MKRRITMLLSTALLIAACSDNGPTSPSPMPTVPTTPPTTTPPPGQADTVPQVAGLYRGEATVDHQAPAGGGGINHIALCMDVEQDGTTVTMEPWRMQGTIHSDGRLTDVALTIDESEIVSSDIRFEEDSLVIDAVTRPPGSDHRFVRHADLKREGPPTEKCEPQ